MSLILFPTNECLVTRLLDELSNHNELSELHIITPTKRLKHYINLNLAKKRTAFQSPKITTLIEAGNRVEGLSVVEAQMIMESCVEAPFKPKDVHELFQLYEELCHYEIPFKKGQMQLQEFLQNESYRERGFIDAISTRLEALADLYERFEIRLGESHTPKQAELLSYEGDFTAQKTFIFGFTSMAEKAIRWLNESRADIEIWMNQPPKIYNEINPMTLLIESLKARFHVIEKIAASTPYPRKTAHLIHSSRFDEIKNIKSLIDDNISSAILCPDEKLYVELLRREFPDANIALSQSFKETRVGSWVAAACVFLKTGKILSLAIHEITISYLETRWEDFDFFVWNECINQNRFSDEPWFHEALKLLKSTIQKKDIHTWLQTFHLLEFEDAPGQSVFIEKTIHTYLESIERVKLSTPFFEQIETYLLNQDIQAVGDPLASIQILTLTEARFYPFDQVFILGMFEGSFPKALPKDIILDDFLKTKMGLPGWKMLEAREELTFSLLSNRLEELYFSTYENDEKISSHFIPHDCDTYHFSSPEHLKWKKVVENPVVTQPPTKPLSASLLEKALSCPYRYLLSSLKIETLFLPEFHDDVREEGTWLHDIIAEYIKLKPAPPLIWLSERSDASDLNVDVKLHLKHFAWPRFVKYVEQQSCGVSKVEEGFKFHSSVYKSEVKGFIDHYIVSDHVEIIDYKRKYVPLSNHIQLSFYAHALEELLDKPVSKLSYYSLFNGKEKTISEKVRKNADYPQRWAAVQSEISSNHFRLDPSDCSYCSYAGICRKEELD